jgi:beta-galactosidase
MNLSNASAMIERILSGSVMKSHFCFLLASILTISAFPSLAAPPRWQPWNDVMQINDGWKYVESEVESPPADLAGAATVSLPHTWNAKDSLVKKDIRRGASWYVREFDRPVNTTGKRVFVRCGAAGQQAEVFLNGKRLGGHVGGYSAFTFELTNDLLDNNQLAIRVSNAHDPMVAPLSGDFNPYGGLYRGVSLITAPSELGFSRTEQGGPGVRVWSTEVSATKARVRVEAVLDNGGKASVSRTLVAELVGPDGKVAATTSRDVTCEALGRLEVGIDLPEIANPRLWSPESPELYTVRLKLLEASGKAEEVRVRHGFRWFEFTADRGFFLNGKPYRLIGINRHQDREGFGNALADEHHDEDMRLIKESGANYLRLAHYQQDDYILQRCDEIGLLVQEEVPYVNQTAFEPAFEANLRTMMREMITQHFNHPSVIVWGMGNEVGVQDRGDGKARNFELVSRLHALVHELDPIRKTLFVLNDTDSGSKLGVMGIPDLIGYNLYHGWYKKEIGDFTARVKELHRMNPDKPLLITEFGADSDRRLHSVAPKRYDFTEEYQVTFLEGHLDQMDRMPWLAGFNWWVFADFGSSYRGDSIPHVNQKGLVTFRREKKDAFYLWKARFSNEPVMHIQSTTWTKRHGPEETMIRVLTNLPEVELFHNGASLGKQTNGFRWPIHMKPGSHSLIARGAASNGKAYEHKSDFEYIGEKKIYAVASSNGRSLGQNLVDGSAITQWFARAPAWAEVDLETPLLIDGLVIEPFEGEKLSYQLKISGRVSEKDDWDTLWEGDTTRGREFPVPQDRQREWRFIRIDGYGNNEDKTVTLNDLRIQIGTDKKEKNLYERLGEGGDQ